MNRYIPTLLGLALAASAFAQTPEAFEISPFAGYLFGGQLTTRSPDVPRTSVDDDADYGLRVGWNATPRWQPELQWTRSATRVSLGFSTLPTFPVEMDYFLAGVTYNILAGAIRPYVSAGLGAALLDTENTSTEARFTGSLGLGVKFFLTPHIGARVEARGYASSLGRVPFGFACTTFEPGEDGESVVPVSCTRSWLLNGDVTGGLVIAF